MEAARDEIKIMNVLNDPINNNHHIPKENISYFKNDNKLHPGYNHVMQLKDDFEISGPNGIHICMVFEILGENVLNLIYRYKDYIVVLILKLNVKKVLKKIFACNNNCK